MRVLREEPVDSLRITHGKDRENRLRELGNCRVRVVSVSRLRDLGGPDNADVLLSGPSQPLRLKGPWETGIRREGFLFRSQPDNPAKPKLPLDCYAGGPNVIENQSFQLYTVYLDQLHSLYAEIEVESESPHAPAKAISYLAVLPDDLLQARDGTAA